MISLLRRWAASGPTPGVETLCQQGAGMIEHPEAIDRREFGKRIFAIGATFAVGGALIRQATLAETIAVNDPISGLTLTATSDLDALLKQIYSEPFFRVTVSDSELAQMFMTLDRPKTRGRDIRIDHHVPPGYAYFEIAEPEPKRLHVPTVFGRRVS